MKFGVVISLISVLFFASCGNKRNSAAGTSKIAAETIVLSDSLISQLYTINLGRVSEGESILKEITLVNDTDHPIIITNIDAGCGCILFEFSRKPIAAGESGDIKMRFFTVGLTGDVMRVAKIKCSGCDIPKEVMINATVH